MTSSHDPDDSVVAETADAMPGIVADLDDSASVVVAVASLLVVLLWRIAVLAAAAVVVVVVVIFSADSNPDHLDFRNSSGSEYVVCNAAALVCWY